MSQTDRLTRGPGAGLPSKWLDTTQVGDAKVLAKRLPDESIDIIISPRFLSPFSSSNQSRLP